MIFDAHSDTWSHIAHIRETTVMNDSVFRKYHYDNFVQGKISGSIFVIWIDKKYLDRPRERTLEIMKYIKEDVMHCENVLSIVKNYDEMIKAQNEGKIYVFIGLEGLDSIKCDIDLIDEYYAFGARHASLTWNERNCLATGAKPDTTYGSIAKSNPKDGLTDIGRKAVQRIFDKNMILDVSHLNDQSFLDVADIAGRANKPIIASHSNSRTLCDVARNLPDDHLKIIKNLNGVVGINIHKYFIDTETEKQNPDRVIDHIKHMTDLIGIDHIGIGFDYEDYLSPPDNDSVEGFENASKSGIIIEKMMYSGFTNEEAEKIAYKNFHRIIKEILI